MRIYAAIVDTPPPPQSAKLENVFILLKVKNL